MIKLKKKIGQILLVVLRHGEGGFIRRLRKLALKLTLKKIGRNAFVWQATYIDDLQNVAIGDNVSIHQFCLISGYGGVSIGNDVSIAAGAKIFSATHPYDNPEVKIRNAKLLRKPVEIGNDVWIGANAVILPGVTIGSGVVIGAGSVVTKNLEDNGIYAGVPARLIKRRI